MDEEISTLKIHEKPANLKREISRSLKDYKRFLKKKKYQSLWNAMYELTDLYKLNEEHVKSLEILMQMTYLGAHMLSDLDGSNGMSIDKMQEYGLLPMDREEVKPFPPSIVFCINEYKSFLELNDFELDEMFSNQNRVFADTGYFSYSLHALWRKLEENYLDSDIE